MDLECEVEGLGFIFHECGHHCRYMFFSTLIPSMYIFVLSVKITSSILNLELHDALMTSSVTTLALCCVVSLTILSFGLCKQFSQTLVKRSACIKVRHHVFYIGTTCTYFFWLCWLMTYGLMHSNRWLVVGVCTCVCLPVL